jgi:transcriptional regulator with XRE-family HTH domain
MKYNYGKLLGRIKEVGVTQVKLSDEIGMSPTTLSQKLNGRVFFKQTEISDICEALSINGDQIGDYFFTH